MSKFKMPTAYTILLGLIILVAIATWFVPAGMSQVETATAMMSRNKMV